MNSQTDLFKVAADLLIVPIQMELCETRTGQLDRSIEAAREIRRRADRLVAQIDFEFPRKYIGAMRAKGQGYVPILVAVRDFEGVRKGDEAIGSTLYATAELAHAAARRWAMDANRESGEAA